MSRTVLVVCPDQQRLSEYESAVATIADSVYVATTFPQAKAILLQARPDVLISELRLKEFNGLHLALWSRVWLPHLRSIIIGRSDPKLEVDARAYGFAYLKENDAQAIVRAAQQALLEEVPQPRLERPASDLSAQLAGRRPSSLK